MSTTLTKIAEGLTQSRHDGDFKALHDRISEYPEHEKRAVLEAVNLVKEAEASGEIQKQTPFSRLYLANELTKAAAISGNEEFQKEAMNAFAAGQLAGDLLEEYEQRHNSGQ